MREVVYLFNILKELDIINVRTIKNIIQKDENNLKYFKYDCGASKEVLIGKEWVLKFTRYGGCDEAYQEYLIYQDAKTKGLEMFFPETVYAGEINGIKFVYQKKIDFPCSDSDNYKFIDKKLNKANIPFWRSAYVSEGFFTGCASADWAKMGILLYGYKKMRALEKFTCKHRINDLHSGNLGYLNKKPIILDFCGYHR